MPQNLKKATFAGGCFWCMQPPYDKTKGVIQTTVGYAGGSETNPSYEEVSSGKTQHVEAIQVLYDANKIDFSALLDIYWHNIDPLDTKGQFCDKGKQYVSVIFYHDEEQKQQAQKSKEKALKELKHRPVATEIRPFTTFYPAEEYHQDYYKKNPIKYQFYRFSCGRDKRLKELWQ